MDSSTHTGTARPTNGVHTDWYCRSSHFQTSKKNLGKWETKHPKNMGERDEDGTGHTNPLPPASHIATVGVLAALLWIQLPAKVWKMASPWNPAPTLKTSRKLPALDWLNSDHCSYWWVNHQEKKISFSPSLCVSPFQIKINLFYFNGQW